jgi:hypothetical protein
MDWGFAELAAFGTLLESGTKVRLSGQDAQRGTFTHRHTVLLDINKNTKYIPLANISPDQAEFEVINSSLRKFGVFVDQDGEAHLLPLLHSLLHDPIEWKNEAGCATCNFHGVYWSTGWENKHIAAPVVRRKAMIQAGIECIMIDRSRKEGE